MTGPLIYRHSIWMRLTHWVWAICLFFLVLTGLQIFNAYPKLQIGQESGFEYDNAIFEIGAIQGDEGIQGYTRIFGHEFDTTGVFGVSGGQMRAFPAAVTIPSYGSLATGRLIHFFFAWLLVGTLLVWLGSSLLNGHIRQLGVRKDDMRSLRAEFGDHVRLRFPRGRDYGTMQKLAYAGVLFALFPLMILTGLSMSPGFNAIAPWLVEVFGGRQTARTLHFGVMIALVAFVLAHLIMVLAAGPLNGLRSMLTGWSRIDDESDLHHTRKDR